MSEACEWLSDFFDAEGLRPLPLFLEAQGYDLSIPLITLVK